MDLGQGGVSKISGWAHREQRHLGPAYFETLRQIEASVLQCLLIFASALLRTARGECTAGITCRSWFSTTG